MASFESERDALVAWDVTRAWTPPRTKVNEAVPGFEMGDRKGRPYAGPVAELFGCDRLVYETR